MTMEPIDQVEGVAVNSSEASYPLGESKPLPDDFVPSDSDVICGRARENFHHGEFALTKLERVVRSHRCKKHVFSFSHSHLPLQTETVNSVTILNEASFHIYLLVQNSKRVKQLPKS